MFTSPHRCVHSSATTWESFSPPLITMRMLGTAARGTMADTAGVKSVWVTCSAFATRTSRVSSSCSGAKHTVPPWPHA